MKVGWVSMVPDACYFGTLSSWLKAWRLFFAGNNAPWHGDLDEENVPYFPFFKQRSCKKRLRSEHSGWILD